jgi:hypothetical protein
MTKRFNTFLLATVFLATAGVGVVAAAALGSADSVSVKSDRLFSAELTADGFMTVEYRGDQLSVLARVPLAPNF